MFSQLFLVKPNLELLLQVSFGFELGNAVGTDCTRPDDVVSIKNGIHRRRHLKRVFQALGKASREETLRSSIDIDICTLSR